MMEDQYSATLDPDRVYETYVKPLEQDHKNEYVLVTPAGKTVLAPSLLDAVRHASRMPSNNNIIFKVGQKSVGTIG
jgi:hypothetical protein